MDSLRAVVERITYYNEDNGYAVLKCAAKGFVDLVTVVGNMAEINVGSVLSMTGEWKVDPKYGRQFSMFTYEETLPATVELPQIVRTAQKSPLRYKNDN